MESKQGNQPAQAIDVLMPEVPIRRITSGRGSGQPEGALPAVEWRKSRIRGMAEVAHEAQDQASEIYGYAAYKTATSLQLAGLLRQAAQLGGWLTPEIEREIARLTLDYLKTMHGVTGEANEAILGVVRSLAEGSGEPGLWDTLALWLNTH